MTDAELDALVARAKEWVRRTEEWGAATEFVSDLTDAITALRQRVEQAEFEAVAAHPNDLLDVGTICDQRDAARAEVEALRHDVERHVSICAEQAQEIEQLRALLTEIRNDRDLMRHHDCLPCPGNCDACVMQMQIDGALAGKERA